MILSSYGKLLILHHLRDFGDGQSILLNVYWRGALHVSTLYYIVLNIYNNLYIITYHLEVLGLIIDLCTEMFVSVARERSK